METAGYLREQNDKDSIVNKELLTFIALAIGLAWACDFAGLALGVDFNDLEASTPVVWALLVGTAWAPAVAGMITRLIYHRTLRGMGWGNLRTRYLGIGAGLVFVYVTIPFVAVWLLSPGTFAPSQVLPDAAAMLGSGWAPPAAIALIYQVLMSIMLIVPIGFFALGEEIGWSGVMVPALAQRTSFVTTSIVTGIIWVSYHLPLMLAGGYFRNLPVSYGLTVVTIGMTTFSFTQVWLRLRSGSIWPAVLSHTLWNVIVFYGLEPLTHPIGITSYLVGDSGALTAILTIIGAVWLTVTMRRSLHSPVVSREMAATYDSTSPLAGR